MHSKKHILFWLLICRSIFVIAQDIAVDTTYLTISKELEDIVVVQQRSANLVEMSIERQKVNMDELALTPKFLGVSDPIRFLQSIAGIQTNNETRAGLHIQGCDDYQTLISINEAPIYYPNHLLGLFSGFISPHFSTLTIEQSAHSASAVNRLGGLVNIETKKEHPKRFRMEGNLGLVSTDLTMAIPCGKKSALWLSGRTSFLNQIYKRWLNFEGIQLGYHFQDYNLTYAYHPTEQDELLLTGFYSRDKIGLRMGGDLGVVWHNAMGNARYVHTFKHGTLKTQVSYSAFMSAIDGDLQAAAVHANADFGSLDAKMTYEHTFNERMSLTAEADYHYYRTQPMQIDVQKISIPTPVHFAREQAHEWSAGIDWNHQVNTWFDYSIGLRGAGYTHNHTLFGGADPRLSLRFHPHEEHHLSLHIGTYTQYFHKSSLTGGGLPTDFFYLASTDFAPERAIAANITYSATFLEGKYGIQTELYFKQLYHLVESTANLLQLINRGFDYRQDLLHANGRNYGLNIMFQRKRGIVTGHISYSLGWARRQIPALDGSMEYIYAASHERRHDFNLVLNTRFAKKWCIGAQLVIASGLPYTPAVEAYMLNGQLFCKYATFNGTHMPLYNRLDLSCSYDIIQKKGHTLGINLSLYNVYCYKNAQFVVYRENSLKPVFGTSMSTIIPSVSIYGTL